MPMINKAPYNRLNEAEKITKNILVTFQFLGRLYNV